MNLLESIKLQARLAKESAQKWNEDPPQSRGKDVTEEFRLAIISKNGPVWCEWHLDEVLEK